MFWLKLAVEFDYLPPKFDFFNRKIDYPNYLNLNATKQLLNHFRHHYQ